MNWQNLKTRTKLIVGFGIVLILTVFISVVGIYNLRAVKSKTTDLNLLLSSKNQFILGRLYMRTYVHLKDTQYVSVSNSHIDDALKLASEIKFSGNEEVQVKHVNEYIEGLKRYKQLMSLNEQEIKNQVQIMQKMQTDADQFAQAAIESGLSENHPITQGFNTAQLNVVSFLAYNNPDYYKVAEKAVENIKSQQTSNTTISKTIETYEKDMHAFYQTTLNSKQVELQLFEVGKSITTVSEELIKEITDYVDKSSARSISVISIFALISILIGLLAGYFITQYFTSMIKRGVELAKIYASGNLAFKVPESDLQLRDEMGDLARAMVTMGAKVEEVVTSITLGADQVLNASSQISATTQQLSEGATEQASSVEEVSSSMEEMASNIMQNSDNAMQTENIAIESANGIKQVAEAASKSLDSVREITSKISIINDIAFQTNILALNAAVEAARAGDQGKGFAVVAAEVRKLAERSKVAAEEIVSLSSNSLDITEKAGNLMMKILPEIEKTARLVQEIASASQEQNSGSMQINNALQQLNNVTQQNAAASEELATSAEELSSQAEKLRDIVAYFVVSETTHKR